MFVHLFFPFRIKEWDSNTIFHLFTFPNDAALVVLPQASIESGTVLHTMQEVILFFITCSIHDRDMLEQRDNPWQDITLVVYSLIHASLKALPRIEP